MKKQESFISFALNKAVEIGKHNSKCIISPNKKSSNFDCPKKPNGQFFSAGYGSAVMLPDDIESKKYYIAGYSGNNPAKGVIDPQYAHALWLDDKSGLGGILFISLDIVGLLNKDVLLIREKLGDFCKLTGCRSVNILSTHNHAGIDTMGIWGKLPLSGKNTKFMNKLFEAVKAAAISSYNDRKDGKLFLGEIEVPDMQEDTRTPIVYSKRLTRLRFCPEDGSREIYFINFASHSESLQGCNSLISADFPAYLRERIRNLTGAETVYGVGAIGGMISMKISDEKKLRVEHRLLESTRDIGYRLADYALEIKNERVLKNTIGYIRHEFVCPVENPVLTLACQIGILSADRYRMPDNSKQLCLKTEISYFEIDDLKILFTPCELFPELAYGGYLSAEESAEGLSPDINPTPLIETAKDNNLLIFGLANDELGYVIPPNDFMLNKTKPYIDKAIDRHSRRHYEETNSMGVQTAHYISNAFKSVIKTVEDTKNGTEN